MAYKALYRTYRPTTFDEVAGQEHIVKTLKNALATGKIAHAYLFAGPRGTGKTSMAKLLAKALNCEDGIGHQCNTCKNCVSITDGTHPDVIEIDAASNNGVEQVRDLIDKVKYGTILGKYKVYIIDEVHMMSPGAFNALLKTLEEPPSHVIFILATTEPHKILPTILSRCQRYDFSKLSPEEITGRLKTVLEAEKIEYNEEAVKLIVALSDGGMRDALSILDQVLAYSGDTLNVQDVLDIFALESVDEKISLINSIINGNVSDVLNRLNNYISRGTDIKRLTNDLLIILKDTLIYSNTRDPKFLEQLTMLQATALAKFIKKDALLKMIETLMETSKDYKYVTSINPVFEITLLKLVNMFEPKIKEDDSDIVIEPEIFEEDVEEETIQVEPTPIKEEIKVVPAPKETIETTQGSIFDQIEEPIKLNEDIIVLKDAINDDFYSIDDDLMVKIMVIAKKDMKNNMLSTWVNLKKYVAHPKLGKVASILSDSHPLVVAKNILVLECGLQTIAEKVNDRNNQFDLQTIINTVFGERMFVYGVSRKDSVRLQQKYINLLQLSKLPKADTIELEFIGER